MMDCNKINLKRGSKGTKVTELQTLLQKLGYYTARTDGDYGTLTEQAIKKYQKNNGLLTDGIVGPITCKKLQEQNTKTTTNTNTPSYYKNGTYHSGPHWTGKGCNKIGQCTPYYCAPCSIRQQLTKHGIEQYTQQKIATYAGTTTRGTGHQGIETAIARISKETGIKLQVEWKNFNELGTTTRERFQTLGKIISTQNKAVILHTLYRNKYGHYESIQEVNMNNQTVRVLNSLGSRCNSPAYCGYIEDRSWNTMVSYLRGISQKSICIITKEA